MSLGEAGNPISVVAVLADPLSTGTGANAIELGTTNGPGSTSALKLGTDVNLYRSAANVAKTDDALIVTGTLSTADKVLATGGLGVGNSATGSTPGTCVKKIQVFNASGTSLGYIAVYDAIT